MDGCGTDDSGRLLSLAAGGSSMRDSPLNFVKSLERNFESRGVKFGTD